MSPILCVLNLSNSEGERGFRPVGDLPFDVPTMYTRFPELIPGDERPTIVYIVGHAVLDGIRLGGTDATGKNLVIPEADFAKTIRQRRSRRKTLVVWDICHAMSFLEIESPEGSADKRGGKSWPSNYAHIFACQKHERTWHTGDNANPSRRTQFSIELRHALRALKGKVTWPGLQAQLRDQLGNLQTPEVAGGTISPAEFGL